MNKPTTKESLQKLYDTMPNEASVADYLGISRQRLNQLRQKFKIPYDSKLRNTLSYNDKYGERDAKIIKLHKSGVNPNQIAKKLKLSRPTIIKILLRYNEYIIHSEDDGDVG